MAGWYMNYIGAVSTMLLCAWASTHLEGEPEVRTVLFASGTLLSYLQSAFIPIAAFPASEAPNWRIGSKLYLGFAVLAMFMFIGTYFAFKWEAKKKSIDLIKNSSTEEHVNPDSGTRSLEHIQEGFHDKP